MNSKKTVYLVIASALAVLLAIIFWPGPQGPEIQENVPVEVAENPEPEGSDSALEEDALESPDSILPEPPLSARASRPLGANKTRDIHQKMVAEDDFPNDVAMDQYKSRLWQDLQDEPPELLPHNSPEIDAEIAYRLYLYYGNCSVSPRTQADLDFRINQITARTQNATEEYMKRVEKSAERTFDFFEYCSAIPLEVDARYEAVRWLSDAVYLGHPIAQTQYYEKAMGFILRPNRFTGGPPIAMLHSGLIEEFKSTSRYALKRAVDRGHPEAFLAMSQAYMDDIIYPRDPLLAMAYVRVGELEAMKNRVIESRLARQKTKITPYLTPNEISEANELAHRLRLGENM